MEALGVSHNTVQKIKKENDNRGTMVRVKRGLQLVRPPSTGEEEMSRGYNDMEELTFCNARFIENIADPAQADIFTPQGRRLTSLNSRKTPILNQINLNAERVVLYKNALTACRWNLNDHSIFYVTRGSSHVQIVNNRGNNAFRGELQDGWLVVVPQGFTVVKQARNEGFEYVTFKTNDMAITNPIVGKSLVLRGLLEDVLMNSYDISREEGRHLKYNRAEEMTILAPRRESQRASA